tara:strand:+ start:2564 stop:2938 length:375 start_codon:yes stop_codon:yes gene_type:complete
VSQENNKKIIEDVNSLLVSNTSKERHVAVSDDSIIKVWVKDLTFLEMQEAVKEVVNIDPNNGRVEIDLAGYWKYMLFKCIERTEPEIGKAQLLALRPDILNRITSLLPQPQDLVSGPLGDGLEE